jgi:MFS family permease
MIVKKMVEGNTGAHLTPQNGSSGPTGSPWSPFRHLVFSALWTATVVGNVGTWMSNAASGWLMTTLDPAPLIISLVQVATALPMVLFALPAGALADILDRRRLLIAVQLLMALTATLLAILVLLEAMTPWRLLAFTFVAGIGAALAAPAWQAMVPQLVPRSDLQAAVALNSVGVNISRAIGPALAGLVITALGMAAPFFLNAASFVAVILVLLWWSSSHRATGSLPAERFDHAIRTGLRYVRESRPLRATLGRATSFFLFASAYWALLPLIARDLVSGGPELYGALLGAIGVGAVIGAFTLPPLKAWLGPDRLTAAGAVGTALALIFFALAREPWAALAASFVSGITWIIALSNLNVSTQVALPDWVRARGVAVFVTVMSGAMTLGSIVWGQMAAAYGVPTALEAAAAGALVAVALTWRWKLQTAAGLDLAPSMHWPAPIVAGHVALERGPVMVTIEYRIDPDQTQAFVTTMNELAPERRRDGAFAWNLFEDAAQPGHWLESFLVESWGEHLRQHSRVTASAAALQEHVQAFQCGDGQPRVVHWIAPPSHPKDAGR